MLHALLAYPDYPYDWKTIGYVDGSGGPHGRFVAVTTPPTLDRDTLWPKERKLLEILAEEKAQGRQVWTFCIVHQHASRAGTAGEDHPGGRVHGQGAGRRQGSHPQPQRMDRPQRPRRGRDYLPSRSRCARG